MGARLSEWQTSGADICLSEDLSPESADDAAAALGQAARRAHRAAAAAQRRRAHARARGGAQAVYALAAAAVLRLARGGGGIVAAAVVAALAAAAHRTRGEPAVVAAREGGVALLAELNVDRAVAATGRAHARPLQRPRAVPAALDRARRVATVACRGAAVVARLWRLEGAVATRGGGDALRHVLEAAHPARVREVCADVVVVVERALVVVVHQATVAEGVLGAQPVPHLVRCAARGPGGVSS